ncbi:MAG: hypothetical protein KDA89_08505, partial [Planctomycetaceae bacterium]|nr:hypothetical protein [Planctomycetaceae bacterium]
MKRASVVALALTSAAVVGALLWLSFRGSPTVELTVTRAVRIIQSGDVAAASQALESGSRRQSAESAASDGTAAVLLSGFVRLQGGDVAGALNDFRGLRPVGEIRLPLLRLTGEALYRSDTLG